MILSKNAKAIGKEFDFFEGIISEVKWDKNLADLLVTVYYFWDEPKGCKDKDLTIRFRNCQEAKFNVSRGIESLKANGSYGCHEVDNITIVEEDLLSVTISSNFDSKMLELVCEEIWIED